jgi:hypothetical protein
LCPVKLSQVMEGQNFAMRRFFAILFLVLLLPLKVSAAYAGPMPGMHGAGCGDTAPNVVECQCAARACGMHSMTTMGVSHGTSNTHHCTHFGTAAAILMAIPACPAVAPVSACPEGERVSFHSIVLDVPYPPPTRLA